MGDALQFSLETGFLSPDDRLQISDGESHHLAKSISDAAWSEFRRWLEYFGKVFGVATVAVKPHYTSQNCSNCGCVVKKTLSTRTHQCKCGFVLDRDWNAAINILKEALRTLRAYRNIPDRLDKRFRTVSSLVY